MTLIAATVRESFGYDSEMVNGYRIHVAQSTYDCLKTKTTHHIWVYVRGLSGELQGFQYHYSIRYPQLVDVHEVASQIVDEIQKLYQPLSLSDEVHEPWGDESEKLLMLPQYNPYMVAR